MADARRPKSKKSPLQDAFGAILFATGAFLAFSVAMFWLEGGARENPNPTTAVVIGVIDALGPLMGFACGLGLAALGGAMFFARRSVSWGRHLAGLTGLLIGSTLILGAASVGAGGTLGGVFENVLADRFLGALASTLVGAFIVAVTVWVAWMPARERISLKLGESNPVSAALREGDEIGVSSAEAAALLPLDEGSDPVVPAHPIDVRLRGRVDPVPHHEAPATRGPAEAAEGRESAALDDRGDERAGADLALEPATASSGRADGSAEAAAPALVEDDPSVRVLGSSSDRAGDGPAVQPAWERTTEEVELEDPAPEPEEAAATPAPVTPEWERAEPVAVETETEAEFDWEAEEEVEPEEDSAEQLEVEELEDLEDLEPEVEEEAAELEEVADADEGEEDEDEEEWEYVDEDGNPIDPEELDEYEELEEEEEDEYEEAEPEVELEPSAPPVAAEIEADEEPEPEPAPIAKRISPGDREELLREVGLFILDRQRVAVSMIQREFDLDFKTSTTLLDELQGRGLIGPYLGGRHRDILLTREEWMAKAQASS